MNEWAVVEGQCQAPYCERAAAQNRKGETTKYCSGGCKWAARAMRESEARDKLT